MKKLGAGLLSFLLLFNLIITAVSAEKIEPTVHVQLVNYIGNQTQLTIIPTGDYQVEQANIRLTSGKSYIMKYDNKKISLIEGATTLVTEETLNLLPLVETNLLSINNRNYLGSFQFVPENEKYVRPINEVFMEDYLKGVVPSEMFSGWNREALKAQAVAARTYASTYQSKIINDTINYQVYGGYSWQPNSTAAVDETKGEVLKANGGLISAVFSASNGGKTESNANIWGTTPVPYFIIKEDPFDPKTTWQFSVKKQQFAPVNLTWNQMKENDTAITNAIKTWMAAHGYSGKEIKITAIPVLKLHTPTSGGRVSKGDIKVEFIVMDKVDNNGAFIPQKLEYKNTDASKVRAMVGIRAMLSYLVSNIMETKETITVSGFGDGHGVGLSQWGAQNRAEVGKQKYNEILGFYYDGATIVKDYGDRKPVIVQASSEYEMDSAAKTDTTAPNISGVKISVDNTKGIAVISFNINEPADETVYIKDSNGIILTYLSKDNFTKAGTVTKEYSISSLSNGKYYAGIITIDESKNRSSTLPSFEVKKTVQVKDETAPKISGVKVSVDNKKNKANISFNTNETAKVTVTIKDSKGKILSYLKRDVLTKAGTLKQEYSTTKCVNGTYSVAISAVDTSNNRSTISTVFTVKKAVKTKTGKVKASRLNVRVTASTKSKVIGTLKKNQTVTIVSTTGTWYKIKFGNKTGYVSKTYIN
ncbi:SpoIID/LytB domain-containing protein [Neobacillus soli]|uniref:SpoIID/LytB domain-containing protein n=1 Tax=Neobacillus soli TaxID=220688 RepID=UPI00082490AD|nr:SpoIID/LytB domain-containing protein [Neobacillus soli]